MPAYLIAEVDVTDPAAYDEYRKIVPATIAKYGGKYLVRGGKVDAKEGGWQPDAPGGAGIRLDGTGEEVVPLARIRPGARDPHEGGAFEGRAGGGRRLDPADHGAGEARAGIAGGLRAVVVRPGVHDQAAPDHARGPCRHRHHVQFRRARPCRWRPP